MRSQKWCFTLNNPVEQEAPVYWRDIPNIKFCIWQLERSATGTPHYQGFVWFRQRCYLNAVKALSPRAHWEPARGDMKENVLYCSKSESQIRCPVIFGVTEALLAKARELFEEHDISFDEGPVDASEDRPYTEAGVVSYDRHVQKYLLSCNQ